MAYFFGDDLKNQITNANDIVDVISEHVQLKKSGRNLLGLCPFHGEKTPSFTVSAEKQMYKCFGCGIGGNVVDFVMRIEHLDFQEAMLSLAERAHITVEEIKGSSNKTTVQASEKERIYAINTKAARFFNKCLKTEDMAQQYVHNRELLPATVTSFGIGYAPDSWNSLMNHMKTLGFTEDELFKAGLVSRKETRCYDAFRNRIIFPIIDLRGKVVGFGGRVLDDSKPKYLNSPETPVFDKSRNFYGLNFAKRDNHRTAVIVEGYMDVIALHQAGITNAIATLGTSFTEEHAKILKRYFDDVVISFDSDVAGRKATDRCIEILKKVDGLSLRVLEQTQAKDPDEYIKKFGKDAFEALIKNAQNYIDYKISRIKEGLSLENVEDKIRFVVESATVFAEIESRVAMEAYVKKTALESDISEEAIFSEIYKITGKSVRQHQGVAHADGMKKISSMEKGERVLLSLLYDDEALYRDVSRIINRDFFSTEVFGDVFELIGKHRDMSTVFDTFTDEQKSLVTDISVIDYHIDDKRRCAAELIEKINNQKIRIDMQSGGQADDAEILKKIISIDKRSKKENS